MCVMCVMCVCVCVCDVSMLARRRRRIIIISKELPRICGSIIIIIVGDACGYRAMHAHIQW